MSGKGDADTRSPNGNARSRTWDRVFRNRWTLEDALAALDRDTGHYFEYLDRTNVHILEIVSEPGPRLYVYRGGGVKHMAGLQDTVRFLNERLGPDRVWHRV